MWFDRLGLPRRSLSSPRMRVLLHVPVTVMGVVLRGRLVGGVLVMLGGWLVGRALQSWMLLRRSRIW